MKKRRLYISLVLVCLGLTSAAQQFTPQVTSFIKVNAPVVAITHVKLVDGTGIPAKTDQTIVMEAGKITMVGNAGSVKPPTGAQIIDGTGKTVIPGLVMLHEHMYYTMPAGTFFNIAEMPYSFPRLYLAGGVTTARTAGSIEPQTDLAIKKLINDGK